VSELRLLAPASEVRFVGPMAMPAELYFLARQPVPLAGMAYPSRVDWNTLHDEGLRHVVCLTHDEAPYDPAPLTVTAISLQDLYTGVVPDDPEAELTRVVRAATVVVESLSRGDGVAVHCRGGRGRAGTVLGCALVMLGRDAEVAVDYLDRVHTIRGKGGWPESAWQADVVRSTARRASRG
jgi:atypical dual specificity phosphatase